MAAEATSSTVEGDSDNAAIVPPSEDAGGARQKRGRGRPPGSKNKQRAPKSMPRSTQPKKRRTSMAESSSLTFRSLKSGSARKDMGDLQALKDSIREQGLLQPIGITASFDLVFGERRIEAYRLLGRDTIPARVVNVPSIAIGEHDENELRKEFTPSERVAILQAIGRKPEGRPGENQQDLASSPDAARAAGFGNKETARQAAAVVNTGTPELVEAMDKGEISIDAAAQIAKQPAEEQKRVVALPPRERKTEVRTMRTAPANPARETRVPPEAPDLLSPPDEPKHPLAASALTAKPAPEVEVTRIDEVEKQARYLVAAYDVAQLQRLVALLQKHLDTVGSDSLNGGRCAKAS
jgi:ParB-like chromosome segregation protein Spo0J